MADGTDGTMTVGPRTLDAVSSPSPTSTLVNRSTLPIILHLQPTRPPGSRPSRLNDGGRAAKLTHQSNGEGNPKDADANTDACPTDELMKTGGSDDDTDLNSAATALQSRVRGRQASAKAEALRTEKEDGHHKAATQVQTKVRQRQASARVESVKEIDTKNDAATTVQSRLRQRQATAKVAEMKVAQQEGEAAVTLQSKIRSQFAKREVAEMKKRELAPQEMVDIMRLLKTEYTVFTPPPSFARLISMTILVLMLPLPHYLASPPLAPSVV